MKSILNKLQKIQSELDAPKKQYNNFGKYAYRNCEDILEALKPLLEKNSCVLIINDKIQQIENRFYITAFCTIYCTETGEFIENQAMAREEENKKGMDASQLTGSTSSYARKYALAGMFLIDDNKDSDSKDGKDDTKQDKKDEILSEAQIKRIYAIAKSKGKSIEDIAKVIKNDFGKTSTKDLTRVEYDSICSRLEALEIKKEG